MIKILGNNLETSLAHLIPGQINPRNPPNIKQGLQLLSTILIHTIIPQSHSLQTPHLNNSINNLSKRHLRKPILFEVAQFEGLDHVEGVVGGEVCVG